jgi:pterin-4a-carbinolamine dehydratase
VRFSTHSADGITQNDLICAAKADAIFDQNYGPE